MDLSGLTRSSQALGMTRGLGRAVQIMAKHGLTGTPAFEEIWKLFLASDDVLADVPLEQPLPQSDKAA